MALRFHKKINLFGNHASVNLNKSMVTKAVKQRSLVDGARESSLTFNLGFITVNLSKSGFKFHFNVKGSGLTYSTRPKKIIKK